MERQQKLLMFCRRDNVKLDIFQIIKKTYKALDLLFNFSTLSSHPNSLDIQLYLGVAYNFQKKN